MKQQTNVNEDEMLSIMYSAVNKEEPALAGKMELQLTGVTKKEIVSDGKTQIIIKLEFTTATKTQIVIDIFQKHFGLFLKQMALAFNQDINDVAGFMMKHYCTYFIQSKIAYGKTGQAYNNCYINELKTIEESGYKPL